MHETDDPFRDGPSRSRSAPDGPDAAVASNPGPAPDSPVDEATRSRWPLVGKVLGVVVLAVVLGLVWNAWDQEAFTAWKEDAGPVPYFLVMAVVPALGLPITPFFILAGATFGSVVGLVGSLLALAANFTLCYWIARSSLQPFVIRLLGRFSVTLPEFDGDRRKAVRFVLLVKFAPGVPAFAKNYLLGAAGVPFWLFFALSMLISGVYAVAFVLLGESALERDPGRLLTAVAIIMVAAVGVWLWRRRRAGVREQA